MSDLNRRLKQVEAALGATLKQLKKFNWKKDVPIRKGGGAGGEKTGSNLPPWPP